MRTIILLLFFFGMLVLAGFVGQFGATDSSSTAVIILN